MLQKLNKILDNFDNKDQINFMEKVDLRNLTTMKLGGTGLLIILKSLEALQELLPKLVKEKINYNLLGIGANQVLKGDILYLKLQFPFDRKFLNKIHDEYPLPASVPLSLLTNHAKKFSLNKWEYLTGIPATLGGAVFMNAGIAQGEICTLVKSVKLVEKSGAIREVIIDKSSFSYRKNNFVENGEVIYEVTLKNLGINEDIPKIIENYLEKRTASQPWKDKTCGCVFKNYSKTCRAGHFIDIMGLKGFTYRGIKISHLHGNFFVNGSDASIEEFLTFIDLVKLELKLQYNLEFELEVQVN